MKLFPALSSLSPNALGAMFMMGSMAGFVVNDTLMKLAMGQTNLFQAIFMRGFFAVILMAALCWFMGSFKTEHSVVRALAHPMVFWRTLGEAGGTFFFLTALFNMQIVNVTAVLQILPLTVTLAAAMFLGESVGWRRYLAIFAGFAGVMIIIRPGADGFTVYSLYALAATFFITLREIATRRLPVSTPSLLVSLITAIVVFLMGGIGSMFETWTTVDLRLLLLLFCAASIVLAGYVFSILAMRHGDVSFVSPFRYSILIWALLLGFFVFGDVPDFWASTGAVIVVGSGLFSFYRERRLERRAALAVKGRDK